ncbi:MAG: zinc ribbon domain-containing protein [Gammaproteobacteria bacterium]|nr:zinc ribbon domain-containing protein [Gammaproteobacteria bacterium]
MPIYEYQCRACGHRLEKLQKLSDERLTDCPACSKPDLQKLVSAAGFRLKGGGWYETDFKGGSRKNVAGESASESAGSDTSSKDTSSGDSGSSDSGSSDSGSSDSKSSDGNSTAKSNVSAAAS